MCLRIKSTSGSGPVSGWERADQDRKSDYIPLLSTITNIRDLCLKKKGFPKADYSVKDPGAEAVQRNNFYTHIKDKEPFRCILGTIPFAGNLIIGLFDWALKEYRDKQALIKLIEDAGNHKNSWHVRHIISMASSQLQNDVDVMSCAAKCDIYVMADASEKIRDSEAVWDTILDNCNHFDSFGGIIEYASERLKNDDRILLKYIKGLINRHSNRYGYHNSYNKWGVKGLFQSDDLASKYAKEIALLLKKEDNFKEIMNIIPSNQLNFLREIAESTGIGPGDKIYEKFFLQYYLTANAVSPSATPEQRFTCSDYLFRWPPQVDKSYYRTITSYSCTSQSECTYDEKVISIYQPRPGKDNKLQNWSDDFLQNGMKEILKKTPDAYIEIRNRHQSFEMDDDFLKPFIMEHPETILSAPARYREDTEFMTSFLKKNPRILVSAPEKFWQDMELVNALIEISPKDILKAPSTLTNDSEYMLAYFKKYVDQIKSDDAFFIQLFEKLGELRSNDEFMKKIIMIYPKTIFMARQFHGNNEYMNEFLHDNPSFLIGMLAQLGALSR